MRTFISKFRHCQRRKLYAAAMLMAIGSPATHAGNLSWTVNTSADWNTASDWSTGAVPGATDDVTIAVQGNPYTVTVDSDVTIDSLTLNANPLSFIQTGGTFTANGMVYAPGGIMSIYGGTANFNGGFAAWINIYGGTVNFNGESYTGGGATWTAGTIAGSGSFDLAPGGNMYITGNGAKTLARDMQNDGTLSESSTGAGTWAFADGVTFTNNSDGIVQQTGGIAGAAGASIINNAGNWYDTDPSITWGDALTFNNTGTFQVAAGSNTRLDAVLNNTGTLNVTSGTLTLANSAGSSDGLISIQNGASLILPAGFTLGPDATFANNGGTLNFAGGASLSGTSTWNGGTMTGNGSLTVSSTGTLNIGGGTSQKFLTTNLTNNGIITLSAGTNELQENQLYLNGVTLTNAASGTITLQNYSGITAYSAGSTLNNAGLIVYNHTDNNGYTDFGGGLTINNTGTFRQIGSGTRVPVDYGQFNNNGLVDVQAGGLVLDGGGISAGTFNIAAGTFLEVRMQTIQPGASFTGTGQMIFYGSSSDPTPSTVNIPWTFGGTTALGSGAIVNFQQAVSVPVLLNDTSSTTANFAVAVTAPVTINAGTANFNGPVNAAPVVNSGTANFALPYGGSFTNTGGTLNFAGGESLSGTSTWNGGTITGAGSLAVSSTGTLNIGGGTALKLLTMNLTNQGTIALSAGTDDNHQDALDLANGVTLTNSTTGTITLPTYSGIDAYSGSATLNNAGLIVYDHTDNNGYTDFGYGMTINNTGTFRQIGPGGRYPEDNGPFNNSGLLDVQAGGFGLFGDGTGSGQFNVATGAALYFGDYTFANAATFTGSGTVNFDGGTNVLNSPWTFGGTTLTQYASNLTFNAEVDSVVMLIPSDAPPSQYPTVNFNAAVNTAPVINVGTANFALAYGGSFTNNGGTVNFAGGGSLSGTSTWNGGTITGAGSLSIGPTGTLTIGGGTSFKVLNASLSNQGLIALSGGSNDSNQNILYLANGVTLTNTGTINLQTYSGINASSGSATLNNSGLIIFDHEGSVDSDFGYGLTINNSGTFRQIGPGIRPPIINGPFNNSGLVDVEGTGGLFGGLYFAGGGTGTGQFNVGADAELVFLNYTFTPSATFTGTGTIVFDGGTNVIPSAWAFAGTTITQYASNLTFNAEVDSVVSLNAADIPSETPTVNFNAAVNAAPVINVGTANFALAYGGSFTNNGGTVNFAGGSSLSGTSTWNGGTIFGSGSQAVGSTGTLNIGGGTALKLLNANLTNNGTIAFSAGTDDSHANILDLANGVTLTNTGTINFSTYSGINAYSGSATLNNTGLIVFNQGDVGYSDFGYGLTINNSGTFRVIDNGLRPPEIDGVFNNSGLVDVEGNSSLFGGLYLAGGGTGSGQFNVGPNESLSILDYTFAPSATFTGSGTVTFDGGTDVLPSPWAFTGTTLVQYNSNVTFNGEVDSVVTLNVDDDPSRNPTVNFNGPVNAAPVVNSGTANFALPYGGSLTNTGGTVNLAGGASLSAISTWTAGTMTGSGVVAVSSTGTLNIGGGTSLKLLNANLTNQGTINFSGGPDDSHANILDLANGVTLTNTGTINFSTYSGINTYSGSATLINTGLIVFNQGDVGYSDFGYGLTINNNGTFRVIDNGFRPPEIDGVFNNSGLVDVEGNSSLFGGLYLAGGGTGSGQFNVGPNESLAILDYTFTPSATFTGSGTVTFDGGTDVLPSPWAFTGTTLVQYNSNVTFNGEVDSVVTLNIDDDPSRNPTVNFNGTVNATPIINSGTANFNAAVNAGVILGGGTVKFAQAPSGSIVASSGSSTLITTSAIYSSGTLTAGTWIVDSGATIGLSSGSISTIGSTASVTLSGSNSNFSSLAGLTENDGSFTLDSRDWTFTPTGGVFTNTGTFIRSGIGTTTIPSSVVFSNPGTVNVTGGALAIEGSVSQIAGGNLSAGTWNISDGASLVMLGVSITSSSANVSLSGSGSFAALASLAANSGSLSFSGGASFSTAGDFSTSGSLVVGIGSVFTVNGNLSLSDAGSGIAIAADSAAPGRLVLGGDLSFAVSTGTATINGAAGPGQLPGILDLGGATRNIFVPDGSASVDAVISAQIINGGIDKTGTGTLLLSSTNAYSGSTTVSAGTLLAGAAGAIGDSSLTISSGATFNLNGYDQSVGSFTGSGNVLLGGANFTIGTDGSSSTFAGAISGNGSVNKSGTGTLTFSGSNSFTGPLNINAGTLMLSSANSFTGNITVANGSVLSIASDSALGNSANPISLASSTLQATSSMSSSRSISMGFGGGSIDVASGSIFTFNGSLTGSSSFNKTSPGTLAISSANSFSGSLSVQGGTLQLFGSHGALSSVSSAEVGVNATLELDNSSGDNPARLPVSSSIILDGGTLSYLGAANTASSESLGQLIPNSGASSVSLSAGGNGTAALSFASLGTRGTGATLDFDAPDLGGAEQIFINGLASGFIGSWATINGSNFAKYDQAYGVIPFASTDYTYNTFTPNTFVMLDPAVTNPPLNSTPGTVSIYTLSINASTQAVDISQTVGSTLTLALGGLIKTGNYAASISGGYLTSGTSDLNISVEGGALTISSELTGNFNLTKRGSGTLILAGSASSNYSGVSVISGTLELNKSGAIAIPGDLYISGGEVQWEANEQLASTSSIYLQAGTMDLNGYTQTIDNLFNTGGTLLFNHGTLNVNGTFDLEGGTTTIASTLNGIVTISGGSNSLGAGGIGNISLLTFTGSSSPSISLAASLASPPPGQINLSGNVSFVGSAGTAAITTSGFSSGLSLGILDLGKSIRTFTINDGTSPIDMSVSVTVQNGGIAKAGSGTLELVNANTYSLGTTLESGAVQADDPAALGSGPVTFSGGTLALRSDAASFIMSNTLTCAPASNIFLDIGRPDAGTAGNFILNNSVTAGALLQVSDSAAGSAGGILTLSGPLLLQSNLSIRNSVPVVLTGSISGSFGITQEPYEVPASININGSASNTYSGSTDISGTTLILSKSNAAVAIPGNLTLHYAMAQLQNSQQISATSTVTLTQDNSAAAPLLDLNGYNQQIAALTIAIGGSASTAPDSGSGVPGVLTLSGGITLTGVAPASSGITQTSIPKATGAISGLLSLTPGMHSISVAPDPKDSSSDTLTIAASISGTGAIEKDGPGTLELTGNNTFNGGITLTAGTLHVESQNALGNNTITLQGGSLDSSVSITNPIVFNGDSPFSVDSTNIVTLSAVISGTAKLTKTGTGTLVLNNAANYSNFTGPLIVQQGTLSAGSNGDLGSSSASLSLDGGSLQASSSFTLGRAVTLTTNGGSLDIPGNNTLTLNQPITGSGTLNKISTGTLVVPSLSSSFTGSLLISGGTLQLLADADTQATLPANSFINLNGGTLQITSSINQLRPMSIGSAGGTLDVPAGATLSMANPLTGSGPFTKTSPGALALTAAGNTLGTLNLAGGSLSLSGNTAVSKLTGSSLASLILQNCSLVSTNQSYAAFSLASLSMTSNSSLDIGNGALLINYSLGSDPIANIAGDLQSAYDHGQWDAPGIDSSATRSQRGTALGYLDNTQQDQVEVKYTWDGDLNLDGVVNSADLALMGHSTGWSGGDLNYDGKINADDYALFALGNAVQNNSIITGVPEPTLLTLLIPLLGYARRKR